MRQVSGPAAAGDMAQPSMPPGDDAAAGFGVIVAGLQAQRDQLGALRPELVFEDVPAPRTLAPYASAMAATVMTMAWNTISRICIRTRPSSRLTRLTGVTRWRVTTP